MLRISVTPRTSEVRVVGVLDMSGAYWVVRENGLDVRRFYGETACEDANRLARALRGVRS